MSVTLIFAGVTALFALAFVVYGKLLTQRFNLRADAKTPAHQINDGADFVPTPKHYLLAQHFSAIAAAGPIIGPIVAAIYFGWLPALLWVVLGCIFIGALHDFAALTGSIRHHANSIAEIIREHMSRRAYLLFLSYVWLTLIYIIIAFTDITARAFVDNIVLPDGVVVQGGGVATASALYLLLGVAMGVCMNRLKWPLWLCTAIFVPMIGVVIWYGQKFPISLPAIGGDAARTWDYLILIYCGIASIVPVWALLQPRGYLGGFFLYGTLAAAIVGILLGNYSVQYPAFISFHNDKIGPLFPMLFITIACGACSGFHGIVCSGTTSKQLDKETDAHLIGYGGMLLEGIVAVISIVTVMVLVQGSPEAHSDANLIYARGIGNFLGVFGINPVFAVSFGLLAFTTFVYDTLDVVTRLGRYILQELLGLKGKRAAILSTVATLALPAILMSSTLHTAAGKPIAAWKVFWTIFGSSNQLLAALTLLGLTVWLLKTGRRATAFLTGIPMVFMMTMTLWSLLWMLSEKWIKAHNFADPVGWTAAVLLLLAVFLVIEAVGVFARVAYWQAPPPV